jgi:hypothetical protein
MLKFLAVAALLSGGLAAVSAQAAPARTHARGGHHRRHVATISHSIRIRGLLPADDLFAAAGNPRRGDGYSLAAFSNTAPPVALKRQLGYGAVGSVGLEHTYSAAVPRDINGVMMSVPPPAASVVGAGVDYRF